MSDWERVASYRGWDVLWQARTGKMFVRRPGLFAPSHDFHERPASRAAAMDIARAWIDRR